MSYIRIEDITSSDLTPEHKIKLIASAMEWLAMAHAMYIIHGDRAGRKLIEMGCPVRFDDDDEPVIWSGR